MRSLRKVNAIAVCAATVLLSASALVGCGTHPPTPAESPTGKQKEGICPPADSAAQANATPCVSVNPNAYQQSNHIFQERLPASAVLLARVAPVRDRAQANLKRIPPSRRLDQRLVRAALARAGLPARGIVLEVKYAGRTSSGVVVNVIVFGAFTSMTGPAACIYGEVGKFTVKVQSGGIIADGGCLPGPGGH